MTRATSLSHPNISRISPSLSLTVVVGGIVNQIKILSCTNDILPKCWNKEDWENRDLK